MLLSLWLSTGVSARRVVLANMVFFGAWHVAGAICDGFHPAQVFVPFLGALLFVWLRLRFHSIFAAMTAHAATNILGVFKAFKSPCPFPRG